MDINKYTDKIVEFVTVYGLKLIGGLVILILGLWLIKQIMKAVSKAFNNRKINPSLIPFLKSLISASLKVLLAVTVLGMIGIQMTSFIAIIGAAGLAIGMALSGTLQNFAGGVIILLIKPFKVGDWIETQGYSGSVREIQIFNTILKTSDNRTIILPNGDLSTSTVINFSIEANRLVSWTFDFPYGTNVEAVREVLLDIFHQDERIFKDPAPAVNISDFSKGLIKLGANVWVKSENFWGVKLGTAEAVYNALNSNGIKISPPQMEISLDNNQHN